MATPTEIIFEVTEAVEGGFDAQALGYSIFTQGEDWADLKAMVRDAVLCHFGDDGGARVVRLEHNGTVHTGNPAPPLLTSTLPHV